MRPDLNLCMPSHVKGSIGFATSSKGDDSSSNVGSGFILRSRCANPVLTMGDRHGNDSDYVGEGGPTHPGVGDEDLNITVEGFVQVRRAGT